MKFDHDRNRIKRARRSARSSGGQLQVPYTPAGKIALRAKLLRLKREAQRRAA